MTELTATIQTKTELTALIKGMSNIVPEDTGLDFDAALDFDDALDFND